MTLWVVISINGIFYSVWDTELEAKHERDKLNGGFRDNPFVTVIEVELNKSY